MTDTPPIPVIPTQEDRLEPCPFCGGKARTCGLTTGHTTIICGACRAEGPRRQAGTEAEATTAWNTRHRIAAIEPLRDALEEVLRYRRGEGKYRFASLPADERDCAAFDAWQEVETQAAAALAQAKGEQP